MAEGGSGGSWGLILKIMVKSSRFQECNSITIFFDKYIYAYICYGNSRCFFDFYFFSACFSPYPNVVFWYFTSFYQDPWMHVSQLVIELLLYIYLFVRLFIHYLTVYHSFVKLYEGMCYVQIATGDTGSQRAFSLLHYVNTPMKQK